MDSVYRALRSISFRRGPQRVVAGIGGGIARATGWDVTIVRIAILLSFLLPFIGLPLYLVLWLVLPYQDGSIPLERILGGQSRR
ncbi:PspC domain-containing protein [Arthrobacter sp. JSM 101049]|uniref:PspC domain-containing protein n=1 Tax=Arthrobacter sp. JSM 101049 TaxID=929097 RepID=UPI00356176F7